MALDMHQLKAFLAIVSTGSLGRAADTLHVTQPALSRTVRRLEDQLGAPVFERHSKGMQLTAIGAALLPHATLLQREAEQAVLHSQAHLPGQGSVSMKAASFKWDLNSVETAGLFDLTFTVKPGKLAAVIGAIGSCKVHTHTTQPPPSTH